MIPPPDNNTISASDRNAQWGPNKRFRRRSDSQQIANVIREKHLLAHTDDDGWLEYTDGCWKPMRPDDVLKLIRDEVCLIAKERECNTDETMEEVGLPFRALKEIREHLRLDCGKGDIPPMPPDLIPLPNTRLIWNAASQDFQEIDPIPEQYVMHILTTRYDPTAKCKRFMQAIEQILPDEEDRRVVQMYLGAALFPLNYTRKMLVFIGEGSSGKSLLVLLFSKILGRPRVFDLKFEELSERFALASLTRETSLLSGSEAIARTLCGRGGEWAKRLVGGDEFATQLKYRNKCAEFAGRYSVIIVSNNKLRFEFETNGQEWRDRVLPIFFRESIPEAEQDKELPESLYAEEGSGILNWLLDGARMVRRANWKIELNERQRMDRDNLVAFSDPVKSFVAEFIQPDGSEYLSCDAYECYNRLAQQRHLPFLTEATFYRALAKQMAEQHGATVSQNIRGHEGKPTRGYRGFDLKELPE